MVNLGLAKMPGAPSLRSKGGKQDTQPGNTEFVYEPRGGPGTHELNNAASFYKQTPGCTHQDQTRWPRSSADRSRVEPPARHCR